MADLGSEKAAFLKRFGQHVEGLIYAKFNSKEQFLRETGFYAKNLHDILTGKCDPRISTVERLAKALGLSARDILPPNP